MAEAARVGVVSSPRHEAWIEKALETRMVTMLASETPDIKGILDNYQATGIRTVIVDDDVIGESDEMQDELCKWLKTHSGPVVRVILLSDNVRDAKSPFLYRLVSDCGVTDILLCNECGDPVGRLNKLCEEPTSMMEYSRWKTNDMSMWQKKEPGFFGKLFAAGKKAKNAEPADEPEANKDKSKKEKKKDKKAKKPKKGKAADIDEADKRDSEPETSLELPVVEQRPKAKKPETAVDVAVEALEDISNNDSDNPTGPIPVAQESEGPAEAGSLYGDFSDDEDEQEPVAEAEPAAPAPAQEEPTQSASQEPDQAEEKPKKKVVLDLEHVDVPQNHVSPKEIKAATKQTRAMKAVEVDSMVAELANQAVSAKEEPKPAEPDPEIVQKLVEQQLAERLAALQAEADAKAAAEREKQQKAFEEKEAELKRKEQELEDSKAKAEADAAERDRKIDEREAEVSAKSRELDKRSAQAEALVKEAEKRDAELSEKAKRIEKQDAELDAKSGEVKDKLAEAEKQQAALDKEKAALAAEREAFEADKAASAAEPEPATEGEGDVEKAPTVESPDGPDEASEEAEDDVVPAEGEAAKEAEAAAEAAEGEPMSEGGEKNHDPNAAAEAVKEESPGQNSFDGKDGSDLEKPCNEDMQFVVMDPKGEIHELVSALSDKVDNDIIEPLEIEYADPTDKASGKAPGSEAAGDAHAGKGGKKSRRRNRKNKGKGEKPEQDQALELDESEERTMQEGEAHMGEVKVQHNAESKAPSGTYELTYEGMPLPVVILDPKMINYSDFMPKRKAELTLPSAESVVSIASVRGGIGSTHTAVCCGIAAAKLGASVAVAMRTGKSVACMHETLEDTVSIPGTHGIRWRGCDFFPWEEQRAHSHDYDLVIADCGCIDLNEIGRNSATNLFLNHSKVACMLASNSPYDLYLLCEKLKGVNRRQAANWVIGLHSCDTAMELSISDMLAGIAGLQLDEARAHMWRQPFQPSLYTDNKLKQPGAYEKLIRSALPSTFRKHIDEKAAQQNPKTKTTEADAKPANMSVGNAASHEDGKLREFPAE